MKIPQEQSISEDIPGGEASDILSAISNEECSVASEILDKNSSCNSHSQSHIHAAEIIQVKKQKFFSDDRKLRKFTKIDLFLEKNKQNLESDRLGHIDSPEDDENASDATEPFQPGSSLLDDITSVLGHDLLCAIQDSTITEDTTTLCGVGEKPRRKLSAKKKLTSTISTDVTKEALIERDDSLDGSNENPLQFGFENIVFEMDNRCDDQKVREPIRYCSLAQFVEGNDIARKSFKVTLFSYLEEIQNSTKST